MKEYNRVHKQRHRSISSYPAPEDVYDFSYLRVNPTRMNFNGSDPDEPRYCSTFGCGKELSLDESRFGGKCVHCQNKKKLDITIFVSQSKIA